MKIKVNNVEFAYNSTPVLDNISMELNDSEVLGIIGPNGTGKSTLIRCIDRILHPKQGTILLDEQDVKKMNQMDIAKNMGYVPQNSKHVFPATVLDTVLMGRHPHINLKSSNEDMDKVLDILEMLGIMDISMNDFNEISGGQQQKVLIARALAQQVNVLLLDEPTSNLDIRHQLDVMELIVDAVKKKGISAIMAIHDLNLATKYADRIIMMNNGRIFAAGKPAEVLTIDNIRCVYGVEVLINYHENMPYIIPIRSVEKNIPSVESARTI